MHAHRSRALLFVTAACALCVLLWLAMRDSHETSSKPQPRSQHSPQHREVPSIATPTSTPPVAGGLTLVVKVHGEAQPLAAAEVRIDDETPVVADDSGIARIAGRAPDTVRVSARAAGFSLEQRWVRIEPGGAETVAEFDLTRGAPLSGIVVDEQGKRIANAQVSITRLDDDSNAIPATSDANGAWEIDAVAAGRYHTSAIADGLGPTIAAPLELDGKTPRSDVVVRVSKGGTLFGKVRDTNGHAVSGVKIAVQQEARVDQWDTTTDARGRYEIRGLPEGSYLVMRYLGRFGYTAHHALIVPGLRTEQDLVVDDDRVEGIVVDTKGTPLAGIWVTDRDEEVATDARGRFALLLHEGTHALTARREKQTLGKWPSVEVEGSASDIRIVLAEAGAVTGRVLLDGAPVSDYAITIAPPNDGTYLSLDGHSLHAANGRFTLTDLPIGSSRIVVAAAGCDVAFSEVKEIAPNKTIDIGDIALVRGRRITGHVRDAAGAPVAGARVTLNNKPSVWNTAMQQRFEAAAETVTDAAGAFAFDGISRRTQSSTLTVTARHPATGIAEQRELEGDTIDLVLARTGGIDGIVDGFVGDQTFFVADGDGRSLPSVEVNRAGEFHFDNVLPGTYTIRESMSSAHRRIKPTRVTVEAGRRAKVRAPLDLATVELRVRVTSDCHGAISLSQLDETTSGAAGELQCTGTSTLPYVAAGKYRACDWDRRCANITVGFAPVQTIELHLAKDEMPQAARPPR